MRFRPPMFAAAVALCAIVVSCASYDPRAGYLGVLRDGSVYVTHDPAYFWSAP